MSVLKDRLKAKKEEGAALVIAIILLSAVEILGFALITMSQIDYSVAGNVARSEETLYAAEQGIQIGIDFIANNPGSVPADSPYAIDSLSFRGEESYSQSNEPYPRWNANLRKMGKAPPLPGQPLSLDSFRYFIESTGVGVNGVLRRIRAELSIVPKIEKAGLEGKAELATVVEGEAINKLAATAHP